MAFCSTCGILLTQFCLSIYCSMPRKLKSRASQQRLSPLGKYLATVIEERGINRSRLAGLSGINRSTLAGVMGTKHAPSLESLKAIASGLSKILPNPITVDDLLEIQSGGKTNPTESAPTTLAPPARSATTKEPIEELLKMIREGLSSLVQEIDKATLVVSHIESTNLKPMSCRFDAFVAESLAAAKITSDRQLEALIKDAMLHVDPVGQLRLKMICTHRLSPEIQDLPRLATLLSDITGQQVTQQDLVDMINADCGYPHSHAHR